MASYDSKVGGAQTSSSSTQSSSLVKTTQSLGSLSKTPVGTAGGFEKGQILKGEIIDLRDRDIKIQLNDSRVITAHLDTKVHLSIGERASFQVTDASLSSMSLKLLSESAPLTKDHMVEKALDEALLPHTERNVTAVKELLANQMSINKNSIQNLLRQAATFQNASIGSLVLMDKYKIPMTEVTTSQFEAYRNYEHRILQQISSLTDTLLTELETGKGNPALADYLFEILSNESEVEQNVSSNQVSSSDIFHAPVAEHLDTKINTILNTDSLLNLVDLLDYSELEENSSAADKSISNHSSILTNAEKINLLSGEASLTDTANAILSTLVSEKETFADASLQDIITSLPDSFSRPEIYTILEQFSELTKENHSLASFLTFRERAELVSKLKPYGFTKETEQSIKDGSLSAKEFLLLFKEGQKEDSQFTQHSKTLLNEPLFQSVLKELLTTHWTLSPKSITNSKSLETYYNKLEQELKDLSNLADSKSFLESNNSSSNQFKEQTQNLRDNIDFMKTLNQIFTYVQLPVRLSNQNVHSELFVYTKKNKLMQDNHNIRVLLHLDMEQLGPLDVHLDLQGKHVAAKFYAEQSDSISIISQNLLLLEDALNKKGYSLASEVLKREKEVDIVKDFIAPEQLELGMKRYTFDIRA